MHLHTNLTTFHVRVIFVVTALLVNFTACNKPTVEQRQQSALKTISQYLTIIGEKMEQLEAKDLTPSIERQIYEFGEVGSVLKHLQREVQSANTIADIDSILDVVEQRIITYEQYSKNKLL